MSLYGGWERELKPMKTAVLWRSSPVHLERQQGFNDLGIALHGDLVLANGQWDAGNRAAARQRAYWAITTGGELEFGYGRLPAEAAGAAIFVGACMLFTTRSRTT